MNTQGLFRRTAAMILALALALLSVPAAVLAEEPDPAPMVEASDDGIKEEKTESKDSDPKPLSDEDKKKAKELIGKVQGVTPLKGTQTFDGLTYRELFEGESGDPMATITSADLMSKVLTKKLPSGNNVIKDVWLPAAQAALLSGGFNKFYYVDDYWTPETFDQAFVKWKSTYCNSDGDEYLYNLSTDESKLKYAKNFKSVGEGMMQKIKDSSNFVYEGLSGNKDAYNKILDKWDVPDYEGDILYLPFSKVIHRGNTDRWLHGLLGYAWDCFAICFYDFKVVPLTSAMKIGEDDTANTTYEYLTDNDKPAEAFGVNDTADIWNLSESRKESTTITTSNTITTSSTLSYTEGASISYTRGWGSSQGPFKNQITIGINFSATQSSTSTQSETTGESKTHEDSWSVSGPMKPGTQVNVKMSTVTSQGATAYSCPVTYQYKVAILSLCGSYSGSLPYRKVEVNYSGTARIFGESNGDALADVKARYNNPSRDDYGLVWENNDKVKPNKSSLNTDRFYSSVGGTVTFIVEQVMSKISPVMPLRRLMKTAVDARTDPYTIQMSNTEPEKNRMNLDAIEVKGITELSNGMEIPYYSFQQNKGTWKLCDKDGKLIDKSDYAEIEKNASGTFLVAKESGMEPVHVKYCIDDNIYPVYPTDATKKEYLKTDDLKASAIIDVYIKEPSQSILKPELKPSDMIIRFYQNILGREADEGGLAYWNQQLTSGEITIGDILLGFIGSEEFAAKEQSSEAIIDGLYTAMLNRSADEDGKNQWLSRINEGVSLAEVVSGMSGSDEFAQVCKAHGIEPGTADENTPRGRIEAFVKRCYRLILNREPDAEGLRGWSDALEARTAPAARIIDGFVRSPEYINRNQNNEQSVDILYRAMLNREADAGGKAGWVDALNQGYTLQHIINGFCGSEEFTNICNEFGITAGNLLVQGVIVKREAITPEGEEEAPVVYVNYTSEYTNEEKIRTFVGHCYEAVFGRKGDAEGAEAYTQLILDGKKTPKRVAYEFIFSEEFQNQLPGNEAFIRILYRLYLNREPNMEEIDGWIQMLENGTGLEDIVNGFASSDEFKVIVNGMKEQG